MDMANIFINVCKKYRAFFTSSVDIFYEIACLFVTPEKISDTGHGFCKNIRLSNIMVNDANEKLHKIQQKKGRILPWKH